MQQITGLYPRSSSKTCPDLCHNSIVDEAECRYDLLMTIWNKVKSKPNAGCHSLLCCKPLVVFIIHAFFIRFIFLTSFFSQFDYTQAFKQEIPNQFPSPFFSISHNHHLNLYIANYEYLFYAINVAQSGFS